MAVLFAVTALLLYQSAMVIWTEVYVVITG